jgi:hypothetical protein
MLRTFIEKHLLTAGTATENIQLVGLRRSLVSQ